MTVKGLSRSMALARSASLRVLRVSGKYVTLTRSGAILEKNWAERD